MIPIFMKYKPTALSSFGCCLHELILISHKWIKTKLTTQTGVDTSARGSYTTGPQTTVNGVSVRIQQQAVEKTCRSTYISYTMLLVGGKPQLCRGTNLQLINKI